MAETRVITYGTFDLLHYGHIELLRRAKELGDYLIVAVSTDEFNEGKGKRAYFDFAKRRELVEAIKYVDEVIPEETWDQKQTDIKDRDIDVFVMGADWESKFDELKELCQVVYLERTPHISSTALRAIHPEVQETT